MCPPPSSRSSARRSRQSGRRRRCPALLVRLRRNRPSADREVGRRPAQHRAGRPRGRADRPSSSPDRFRALCRAVEIGPAQPEDFVGSGDEAYGLRVFLRHYCVQLAGEPWTDLAPAFPADVCAARGFNGDVGAHVRRWREALDSGADPRVSRTCSPARPCSLWRRWSASTMRSGRRTAWEPPAVGRPSIRLRPRTCRSWWTGPSAPRPQAWRTYSACSTARLPVSSGRSRRRSACGPVISTTSWPSRRAFFSGRQRPRSAAFRSARTADGRNVLANPARWIFELGSWRGCGKCLDLTWGDVCSSRANRRARLSG